MATATRELWHHTTDTQWELYPHTVLPTTACQSTSVPRSVSWSSAGVCTTTCVLLSHARHPPSRSAFPTSRQPLPGLLRSTTLLGVPPRRRQLQLAQQRSTVFARLRPRQQQRGQLKQPPHSRGPRLPQSVQHRRATQK